MSASELYGGSNRPQCRPCCKLGRIRLNWSIGSLRPLLQIRAAACVFTCGRSIAHRRSPETTNIGPAQRWPPWQRLRAELPGLFVLGKIICGRPIQYGNCGGHWRWKAAAGYAGPSSPPRFRCFERELGATLHPPHIFIRIVQQEAEKGVKRVHWRFLSQGQRRSVAGKRERHAASFFGKDVRGFRGKLFRGGKLSALSIRGLRILRQGTTAEEVVQEVLPTGAELARYDLRPGRCFPWLLTAGPRNRALRDPFALGGAERQRQREEQTEGIFRR